MNKKLFFTVGPSELYPTLPKHITSAIENKIGVISHRGKQFQEIYKGTTDGLRKLLNIPDTHQILFLSSATEIWERIIQNCVEHTSFHCVNGSFSKRFYEFSTELGKKAIKEQAEFGKGFYPEKIYLPSEAEIICLTHNETSSGVSMPVSDINKMADKNRNALLFVDAVSSLPYPAFDFSKVDSTFFSVQKCFGLPAGLGVWILNQRVIDKAEALAKKNISLGTYHTIPSLLSKAVVHQTPETPNVWNIYLLGKVVEDMLQTGIDTIRKETDTKADMLYNYINNSKTFSPAVEDVNHRSRTTIVANTTVSPSEVNKALEQYDMAVGSGYGNYKDKQIRIANFPAYSIPQVENLIDKLKKTLG
ncbi:MAG: aminotransferase class V-fold PLP-dependent enzyme [Cytophagaceae bacterium]